MQRSAHGDTQKIERKRKEHEKTVSEIVGSHLVHLPSTVDSLGGNLVKSRRRVQPYRSRLHS